MGALIGKWGGGAAGGALGAFGGELACAGVPVCGLAGAVGGAATVGGIGTIAGAATGAAVGSWIDGVVQARAGKSRSGNANENRDVNEISRDNNLNKAGERALHDEISRKGLDIDEIRDLARQLAQQAKYTK